MNHLTIPQTVCKQANVTITVNNVDSDLRRIFLIIAVLKIICIKKMYPMKNSFNLHTFNYPNTTLRKYNS